MKILGYDFKTSLIRMKPNVYHWRYVKVPTSSIDWMGSEWTSPTSLTFEWSTMQAQHLAGHFAISDEMNYRGTPPQVLVDNVIELVEGISHCLVDSGRVADKDTTCGIKIDRDNAKARTVFHTRVKTWPSIEGVTVPLKDRTL